jgi:hypothetical protein
MDAVDGRLEPFGVGGGAPPDVDLMFRRGVVTGATSRPAERVVYEWPDGLATYDDRSSVLTLTVAGRIHAVCAMRDGHAQIMVARPQRSDVWLLSHPVLSIVLLEYLKRRGLFPVHAGGLVLRDRAVLLAGGSGAGKSTLSLALARAGFAFLADDTLFLELVGSAWHVRAFPDQVDLCADATSFFPDLQPIADAARDRPWPKWQMRVPSEGGPLGISGAAPAVLIFPRVRRQPASVLQRIDGATALRALAPNVLLTDTAASQRHLDALAGLVAQSACYQLDTGTDLDGAVDVVRAVMPA